MTRKRGSREIAEFDPLRAIEWVIATCTFLGGLYIFTPLYALSKALGSTSALTQTLSHPAMIFFWGAVLLIGAILVLYGLALDKPQFKSAGWFAIIMARLFQILSTFVVAGLLPITWIYPTTIMLVAGILWWKARLEVANGT